MTGVVDPAEPGERDGPPRDPTAPPTATHAASAHGAAVRRSAVRSGTTVVGLAAAFALLPFRGGRWWVGAAVGTVLVVAIIPVTVRRLRRVLASERPGFEAVEALVQLLSMLVIGFAGVYFAMNHAGNQLVGLETRVDAVYFTVVTLATVGFGDVHPVGQSARAVVTLQIVFNLLFLGVAVRAFTRAARRRLDERSTRP